jgi:hypothetical protein
MLEFSTCGTSKCVARLTKIRKCVAIFWLESALGLPQASRSVRADAAHADETGDNLRRRLYSKHLDIMNMFIPKYLCSYHVGIMNMT